MTSTPLSGRRIGFLWRIHMGQRKGYRLRSAVRTSVGEGILAQIYMSLSSPGSIFLTKFALLFNATPVHFGILSAIGQLSQIFQPLGVALTMKSESRKPMVVRLLHASRGFVALYVLLPFILPPEAAIWVFLAIHFANTSLGAVAGNGWIAWITDLIPLRIRGRFFSMRSQYLIIAGLATGYIFGFFVDLFDTRNALTARLKAAFSAMDGPLSESNLPWAFAAIFAIASLTGLGSTIWLSKQPERKKAVEGESFLELFLTPLRDANFRRLMFYGLWWMMAVGIGSPFWQPFMIQKLRMSMAEVQIYGTISVVASLIVLRPWGRLIDNFGNKTAMRIAIVLGGINPMIWVFLTPDHSWLVYVEAATSGIMWSGANIVATNLVLSIAPPGKSQIYSGVFGAFSGLAMMATMLVSSIFMPPAMDVAGLALMPEQVLFALTGFARWSTQIPLTWVVEARSKPVGMALYYIANNLKLKMVHFSFLFLDHRRKDR